MQMVFKLAICVTFGKINFTENITPESSLNKPKLMYLKMSKFIIIIFI